MLNRTFHNPAEKLNRYEKAMSGYHKDALECSIPSIANEIRELFNGYEEQEEKLEAMAALRKELQQIYVGYMKLDKIISQRTDAGPRKKFGRVLQA